MPVKSATEATGESVYRRLRDMIVDASLSPGERLAQRKLAALFQTSNIPVVEALRRLERDGLVDTQAKWGGAQVKIWKRDDIRGLYLARAALEGVTCRLFAESATAVDRAALDVLNQEFNALVCNGVSRAGVEADIALHLHIVRGSNSPSLCQMLESSCLITAAIRNSFKESSVSSGPTGVHDALVAALKSGDPDAAEIAGKGHVMQALELVLARYEIDTA